MCESNHIKIVNVTSILIFDVGANLWDGKWAKGLHD